MKTWKSKKTVCRSSRSGKFASKGKCKAFKRQRIKASNFLTDKQHLLFS